jgi:serine-type D-Ala-D-Ala carboxypeptidase (penicillin-binding protein 5/6)
VTRRRASAPAVLAAVALVLVLLPASAVAAAAAPPPVTARSAIVIEPSSGDVVFAVDPDRRRPIASTTKLMTAYVALQEVALSDVFKAPRYKAGPFETKIGLRKGERMKVSDLLRAMLLPSANDAAATVAVGVSGSRQSFVADMNRHAAELGLRHTHYANPIGLDQKGNYSSARDLAHLAIKLRANAFARETMNRLSATLHTGDRPRTVVNRNLALRAAAWVNGVKTGHTAGAGWVLVGSGTREEVSMVAVVLGEPGESARVRDTLALLQYGMSRYRRAHALRAHVALARPKIRFRGDERLDLVPLRPFSITVKRGLRTTVRVDAPDEVDGPIRKGEHLGTAQVRYRGRVVASVPLVAERAVPAAGFFRKLWHGLTGPLTLILLAMVIAAVAFRARSRRRARRARDLERWRRRMDTTAT